ncbi:MAG: 4a-hydroxytetrahydrobiopterin dehydratase [Oscillatoria sp. PMC 1051.18]|uniref:4a-hydroxytetrahydrobiopterin dehydratase n=1 Tax=Oscillatoria salina TaxID=331517 RepID=UPI0013B95462|nr:4a-hydroxytetrahydrobiopterin dehydratase [Oscillatoria salina]MBZ8183048.1 4a-hydroxytetrahydrobiopterin dehydratase [Oscillatoria salina IIICB1]MEC4892741.1 4a-hydroxytetrahydrobiopterin dehydratase [Oscillatoria sp. PMC 1050.18]MEC5030620.1 4a-hydroxytetrahydrobiopterin dehydratase [Oscillatoria sp. PMC 1051.18]NET91229.1 4a-hydroxytetrahydrobiopterin dehydratase [Kamptonema sp. SIO1D9]
MPELTQQKCEACTKDSQPVSEDQIKQLKPQIPDWNLINKDGQKRLERTYKFPDFQTALNATNKIGAEAEKEGHHPALLTEYGKLTVTWWTHAISGLHKNDFIMAAKTDEIVKQFPTS